MSRVTVDDLLIDDENDDKFAEHGVLAKQVLQLLDGIHTIKRNRRDRRASHLLVGRDRQGYCIAVPIEPTTSPRVWRPITAWYCKDHEAGWLD